MLTTCIRAPKSVSLGTVRFATVGQFAETGRQRGNLNMNALALNKHLELDLQKSFWTTCFEKDL